MSKVLLLAGLFALLLITALLVIDKKYESRTLFIEMQKQKKCWIIMRLSGEIAVGINHVDCGK